MGVDRKLVATVLAYAAVYFAGVVLLRFLPPGTEYTVAVVFVLSCLPPWSLFLTWPWRCRRAGAVRLELGRPGGSHAFRLVLILLVLVPFAIVSAVSALLAVVQGRASLPVAELASGVFALTLTGYFLFLRFGRLQVRRDGITHFPWAIRWSQVESFQVYRDFFELQLKSSWELPKAVDWEVRGVKKRMLAQILAQHISPPPLAQELVLRTDPESSTASPEELEDHD